MLLVILLVLTEIVNKMWHVTYSVKHKWMHIIKFKQNYNFTFTSLRYVFLFSTYGILQKVVRKLNISYWMWKNGVEALSVY
jgi:hypothetical protein